MIIKANVGEGGWRLFDDASQVEFLDRQSHIVVAEGDHDFKSDERFPSPSNGDANHLIHVVQLQEPIQNTHFQGYGTEPYRLMRWVTWRTGTTYHSLITDSEVFILNDQGATVEALR
jgi:hypothetical protein